MPDGRHRVPAVRAAAAVLAALERRGGAGITQAELVRETEISKSTMHNLLKALAEEGYVRRDERSREYRLGPALIPLGATAARQTQILSRAIDALAPLAAEHGLSFAVAQPIREDRAQIVERFYPPESVHVGITIGSQFGIFDGALGKCLLATKPPEEAERLVRSSDLPAFTEQTITDPDSLISEIDEVRSRGWGSSRGELNENNAVAAIVCGHGGTAEAFLLALGFPAQLPDEELPAVGRRLQDLARAVGSDAAPAEADGDKAVSQQSDRIRSAPARIATQEEAE